MNKIINILKQNEIKYVIVEEEILENLKFIEMLKQNDIVIFQGKQLYKYIILEIIERIQKNMKLEENIEISMISNILTDEVKGNINLLLEKYTKIKIITNHPEQFKKVEQKISEELGYPVIITNNKQKALKKSNIIINLDFDEKEINKYNINENAIIVSIENNINIKSKRFNGKIVKDYETNPKKEESEKQIYEKIEYRNNLNEANLSKFEITRNIIKESQIKLTKLITMRGQI